MQPVTLHLAAEAVPPYAGRLIQGKTEDKAYSVIDLRIEKE